MIPALIDRKFGYGSGVIDPDHRRFLLNIPKNASSFMLDWTARHGWASSLINHCTEIQEMIVILRDPVERWVSGMAQYVRSYILSVHGPNGPIFPNEKPTVFDYSMSGQDFCGLYNDLVERLIFDVIDRFDDHVWPQHELIPLVSPDVRVQYFFLDRDFNHRIGRYLNLHDMDDLDHNRGDSDVDVACVQRFLQGRLRLRPELQMRIAKKYKKDYDLISKVIHD